MRIAVLDDYQGVARSCADWSGLEAAHEVTFFSAPLGGAADVIAALQGYDIVCLMRERTAFSSTVIDGLADLKLIVTTGARNAAIDVAAAAARGVTVCGTRSPGHATGELTMGLMLALARRIAPENASLMAGGWQVGLGRDLRGAVLGVIGLGRLGSLVAGFAKAFGMEVIAWSENLTEDRCAEVGVRKATKQELLQSADFITIHQRLSPRTHGLIGAAELALMKPDACLINTSRGPIIDQAALIAALDEGRIGGAALDVFDEEPLPADHPLKAARNLLLTPHLGYVTRETYKVFYGETVEAIEAFLAGAPVREIAP
ncbi:D-2-hydroxyacid dehydrogenase family protein [Breoghania sp. L-A4]|uniref:D-2-hydroxyacid dehydrogenase family protein n=1 Tax=Breoghania sp. L-A4 TaxID=2304600 RepID=UPI000E3592C4|nr:D-2-hydroxyacid dehydrogenase family protein [Breoghania sp. L-A4]AXS42766.1 D-2-hydroxyacid dehydrogenase family protein [Breoghania sp. L-A4]